MRVRRVSGCLELLLYLDESFFCLVCMSWAGYSHALVALGDLYVCGFSA